MQIGETVCHVDHTICPFSAQGNVIISSALIIGNAQGGVFYSVGSRSHVNRNGHCFAKQQSSGKIDVTEAELSGISAKDAEIVGCNKKSVNAVINDCQMHWPRRHILLSDAEVQSIGKMDQDRSGGSLAYYGIINVEVSAIPAGGDKADPES